MNFAAPAIPFPQYPGRSVEWKLRTRTIALPKRPLLMGIVNVTPDSFSDGGEFIDPDAAVQHALRLVEHGADLLDIGGESTRPYSDPVPARDEIDRVLPVVERLVAQTDVPLSIDTSKAAVAQACIDAGVEIINDVTGLEGDLGMVAVAVETCAGVCAMHMQGTPQTMQDDPRYEDVVENILDYLSSRRDALVAAGIDTARICLDPGVGFGKTHQHNLTLLAGCGRFHGLNCPVLVGHSRKGFLGKVLGDKVSGDGDSDRTAATVGVSLALAGQGVQILRVHDVRPVREALLLYEACGGLDDSSPGRCG